MEYADLVVLLVYKKVLYKKERIILFYEYFWYVYVFWYATYFT